MNQVVADPPDALAYIPAVPDSSIEEQLSKLREAGTKIVELSPLGDVLKDDGPIQGVVTGPKDTALSGKRMGDAIVADANGSTDAVLCGTRRSLTDGGRSRTRSRPRRSCRRQGWRAGAARLGIGKTVPSQIVSYLQAHPATKYVASGGCQLQRRTDPALQAAGLLDKVKVISRAADSAILKSIKEGTEWASVALELASSAYRGIDQIISLMNGRAAC